MNNAAGALAGIKELEREAEQAHKRVTDALEGARVLLHGAIVKRFGLEYQITSLHTHRGGQVGCYGVRIYRNKARSDGKRIGVRDYDLGRFTECEILEYPAARDTPLSTVGRQRPENILQHPNHPIT